MAKLERQVALNEPEARALDDALKWSVEGVERKRHPPLCAELETDGSVIFFSLSHNGLCWVVCVLSWGTNDADLIRRAGNAWR